MNTPSKRASAIGIGLALRLVLPVRDGTIDQADRQHTAYSYAGILASSAIVGPHDVVSLSASIRRAVSLGASVRRMVPLTVER